MRSFRDGSRYERANGERPRAATVSAPHDDARYNRANGEKAGEDCPLSCLPPCLRASVVSCLPFLLAAQVEQGHQRRQGVRVIVVVVARGAGAAEDVQPALLPVGLLQQ